MLVVHLSDLHLDASPRSAERARRVVDHVRALAPRPDLVLVTGDVADHGAPAEYEQAAELLDGLDAHLVPGNHDRRPTMRALLGLSGDGPITGRVEAAAERRPLIVALAP